MKNFRVTHLLQEAHRFTEEETTIENTTEKEYRTQ
jgi:hypothetical protein